MAIMVILGFLLGIISPAYAINDPAQISDFIDIIKAIIRILVPAAGTAFFIMVLVGGFKFVTSGGDPKAVASAKATLTYAIIGVILVVVSWLILLVVQAITGVDVTIVNLPVP